jgi:hypothetical protein
MDRIDGMVLPYPVHPMKIWSLPKQLTGQKRMEIEASRKRIFENPKPESDGRWYSCFCWLSPFPWSSPASSRFWLGTLPVFLGRVLGSSDEVLEAERHLLQSLLKSSLRFRCRFRKVTVGNTIDRM